MTHPHRFFVRAALCMLLLIPTIGVADEFRGAGTHSNVAGLFQADAYLHNISVLAGNDFEGRAPGQPGIDKAADYIVSVFEELGVQPAGEDGTYFQPFTLKVHKAIGERTRLSINTPETESRERLRLHDDYIPLPFSDAGRFKGGVVFAGYGITDENLGYDEYAGIDVEDKIVLVLRRAPDFDDFRARHMMFMTKARLAIKHKAAALLIVNPIGDEEGDKLFEFDANANGVFSLASRSYGIPMIHIRQAVAEKMLKDAGLGGLQAVQDRIEEGRKPISQPLNGVTVRGRADVKTIESTVKNVIGLIPGTGPQADEYIILGAHYDHHGIRRQDHPDFDKDKDIFNGADDNASGVAMVMSLAKAYTQGPKPNRSILLIAFTAEELGLIGSRHFAEHPTVDLEDCVAMFNFDMVGRLRDDRLEIGGLRTGDYEETIRRIAERYEIDVKDGGGGQGPSDHTWFYRAGIPVTFWHTGLHKQYSRPEDDTELINEEGAMRIARFAVDVIDEIDARADRPEFDKDQRRRDAPDDEQDVARETIVTPPPNRVRLGITIESSGDGVAVTSVVSESVASRAGLRADDEILQFGDSRIATVDDLIRAMANVKADDTRTIKVRRDGEEVTLTAHFGERPEPTLDRFLGLMQEAFGVDAGALRISSITASARKDSMSIELSIGHVDTSRTVLDVVKDLAPDLGPEAECDLAIEIEVTATSQESIDGTCTILIKNVAGGDWSTAESSGQLDRRIAAGLTFVSRTLEVGTEENAAANSFEAEITLNGDESFTTSIKRVVEFKTGADTPEPPQKSAAHPGRESEAGKPAGPARKGFSDSEEMPSRPPVRIGIMPTHGEQDGEGFGIAGVTEGGPADKAGMKDDDRILTIGGRKVHDVYSYMDALREYEPGDEIEIVVLRDGKQVPLTVKLIKQKKRNRPSAD